MFGLPLPIVPVLAVGLALCVGAVLAVGASSLSALPSIRHLVDAIAITLFGEQVMVSPRRRAYRERLRAGRVDTTYRSYAATTFLYAIPIALVCGVCVATFAAFALSSPAIGAPIADTNPAVGDALAGLSAAALAVLAAFCGGFGAAVAAVTFYWVRWWLPAARASARRRRIDITFSRTLTLLYALSRGGITIPEILRTLRRNRAVYGAAADELSLAVRDMELLGADVLTAVERVGNRTPSDRFAVFCENLGTVLRSGGSTAEFLRGQYERHQRDAETRQASYLEWLATFAEIYVSLLVVGPLFLITVLLVMGLVSGGVTDSLSLLVYLLVPLSNLGFIVALDGFTGPLRMNAEAGNGNSNRSSFAANALGAGTADGGKRADEIDGSGLSPAEETTIRRLETYERKRERRGALSDPIGTVLDDPTKLLYVTVPLACFLIAARVWLAYRAETLTVSAIDDTLVGAAIFLTGTFALVHEGRHRRTERIEKAIPELLDRLASLNEVGVSIVAAVHQLRDSDLGELDPEIERIDRDVALGATVADALARFDARVRAAGATRAVTLITNAMRASGEIAPVLRVAAEEARSQRTRKRKRRQEMATYLVIIYLSFLVFLGIVFVLVTVFMPAIPAPAALGDAGLGGQQVGLSAADKQGYIRLLYHASAIQGLASGFVAGQMANGDVADGAKHAAVMLLLALVSFTLFV